MRTKHLAAALWYATDDGGGADALSAKTLDDILQDFVELTTLKERRKWMAIAKGLKTESKDLQALGKKHRAIPLRDTPFKPTGKWTAPPAVGELTPCTCNEFPRPHHHMHLSGFGGGGGGGDQHSTAVIVEPGVKYEITIGKGRGSK